MKKLIINVDDVGLSKEINEAMQALYEKGVISGVSIMACGEAFEDATWVLHYLERKEVGVHLTLTGNFRPVTKNFEQVKSIVTNKGVFSSGYFGLAQKYVFQEIRFHEVYIELKNQITKVQEEGFKITHLDSHEHIHMLPGILKLTIKLAREFGVPYVRLPLEAAGIAKKNFSLKNFMRQVALKVFIPNAKKTLQRESIGFNDYFLGHFHAGNIDNEILSFFMERVKEGITEVAVHPAISSSEFVEKFPWYKNAQTELNVLSSGDWKSKMSSEGIELKTHLSALLD